MNSTSSIPAASHDSICVAVMDQALAFTSMQASHLIESLKVTQAKIQPSHPYLGQNVDVRI